MSKLFKIEGKNSRGEIIQAPLAAAYDGAGNNISESLKTKLNGSVSWVEATPGSRILDNMSAGYAIFSIGDSGPRGASLVVNGVAQTSLLYREVVQIIYNTTGTLIFIFRVNGTIERRTAGTSSTVELVATDIVYGTRTIMGG